MGHIATGGQRFAERVPERWLRRTGRTILAVAVGLVLSGGAARAEGSVYTVANYPIGATAANAVAAKRQAISEGQRRAFRSLLKRIVHVTDYSRLPELNRDQVSELVDGFGVRNERNSATEYLASLDFRFSRRAVRDVINKYRLSYYDLQSSEITVIPVFRQAPQAGVDVGERAPVETGSAGAWRAAWRQLDLANALTPVRLQPVKSVVRPELITQIADGDLTDFRVLQEEYGTSRVVVAFAQPTPDGKRLTFALAGGDAVGTFGLKRTFGIGADDFAYTAELASVIALGILEGRWKARKAARRLGGVAVDAAPVAGATGASEQVRFSVRFNGLREWQTLRARLSQMPGVDGFTTGAVSARRAEVTLTYPGGLPGFRSQIAGQGLFLEQVDGFWVLRRI